VPSVPAPARVEKLIPLVHIPDDPGPEPEPPIEPDRDPTTNAGDPWRKLRALFK
jgi:hypothetical protein